MCCLRAMKPSRIYRRINRSRRAGPNVVANETYADRVTASLRSYTPSPHEKIQAYITKLLGGGRNASHEADRWMRLLDLTPVGAPMAGYDAGKLFGQGALHGSLPQMAAGGVLGAMAVGPFRGFKGMHPYINEPARNFRGDIVGEATSPEAIRELVPPSGHPHAGFFSSDPAVASRFATSLSKGGAVFPADISFENPIEIDALGKPAAAFQFEAVARQHGVTDQYRSFQDALASPKHDGIILKNTADEGTVYVPKNAHQVRPAFSDK